MKTAKPFLLLVASCAWLFAAVPAHAFAADDVYSALQPGLSWEPSAAIEPMDWLSSAEVHPLAQTALFRFMDRIPLRPTSIGPAPRLPYERPPAMGLRLYVALY